MKRDRNHEGYHDPTAGAAIRRISVKKKKVTKSDILTYRLKEIKKFVQAVNEVKE